ncbi:MAG: hypothetical protein K0Q95_2766 [Bacteroidota bacterium]|nr:hypothetical protein [Bacteroidota bacterium]
MSLCVSAQEEPKKESRRDERNKLHFGVKLGINNSNVYDEEGEEFNAEPKYGFAGGAFLSIPVGKFLGLQPAVLISQKGFSATGKLLELEYELKRTTTYLDVPLMVELKPIRALTLLAGPQYSYLLNQTDILKSGNSTVIQEQEFKNDDIRKNILSAAVGFDIHITRFVVSGRYNFDLQKNNSDGSSQTPRYKNMWLQGTIGLRF